MGMINREDMLELTRRMTVKRNCFARIAGAYLDEEGYIDGTFNQHFLNLTSSERDKNIKLAKAVPFAETNVQLKEYPYRRQDITDDSMRKLLLSLNQSELKNDALLEMFYEEAGKYFHESGGCAVYVFYGGYDIPRKGTDGASQWESEEIYDFLVGIVCSLEEDYEPGEPECGFLYPAFRNRSSDSRFINVFQAVPGAAAGQGLMELLGIKQAGESQGQ